MNWNQGYNILLKWVKENCPINSWSDRVPRYEDRIELAKRVKENFLRQTQGDASACDWADVSEAVVFGLFEFLEGRR